jgi:hypothetical protein
VGCSSGKTSWSNVRYPESQKIEKHPGVTSGTLKVKRLKTSWSNIRYAQSQKIETHPGVMSGTIKVKRLKTILE